MELRFDRGTLLLGGVGGTPPDGFAPGCWKWDSRANAWRTYAMNHAFVRQACGRELRDQVRPAARVAFGQATPVSLRADQEEAVAKWQAAGGRGLVVMPTGTGKTEVALAAMARSRVATLVVAPVRDLMYQWHQRISARLGYEAGILGDARRLVKPVTVTTYDSAYLHMGELGDRFGLLIFDEVHHLPGPSYSEAALFSTAPLRLGLTATLFRADGRESDLPRLVGPIVYEQAVSQAKGRTLADYNVVRIPVQLSEAERARYDQAGETLRNHIAEKRKENPRYGWEEVCRDAASDPSARRAALAYQVRKSIEDRAQEKLRILEDVFRLHVGERVIVFAGTNAMAREVSRRFLVPTILSHTRKDERRAVLEGLASGKFPVLVANRVLDEGVDVPQAKVAVVIGGQASPRQAKQRLGRILRRSGKAMATLYEVVVEETKDVQRSRTRRRSDAYGATRRWKDA